MELLSNRVLPRVLHRSKIVWSGLVVVGAGKQTDVGHFRKTVQVVTIITITTTITVTELALPDDLKIGANEKRLQFEAAR